mmetsp:Transcript_30715/g.71034  ORF Transcript_30715/g.71034 Transcript_30715/m.71034 type:complete len:140 (-) Transcript_30715:363-782(-)
MKQAGAAVGIDFTGKCDRAPNSVGAHTLIKFLEGKPGQNQLAEILFRQYFTDGLYPDNENLRAAAEELLEGEDSPDLDLDAAMAFVESANERKAVQAEAADYSMRGVSGVPFFIFNGQPQFSGAQPVATFKRALLESMA